MLPRMAMGNLFKVGVPANEGGTGEDPSAAIGVVAGLAEHSLSAAFVFWAQRAFIECLLASPNRTLVRGLLPSLLRGGLAGAPGLSNAMKALGARSTADPIRACATGLRIEWQGVLGN